MAANTEIIGVLNNLYQENPWTVFYIYLLFLLLIIELLLTIGVFIKIKIMIKRIKKGIWDKDPLLIEVIEEYKGLLNKYPENIRTDSFIKAFFQKHCSFTFGLSKINKQSDFIFLLLGLLGAFIIILNATINLDLKGAQNLDELLNRMTGLFVTLKPALFLLLFSGICAILSNLAEKVWNLDNKIEVLRNLLINYLENEVKGKLNPHYYHLEIIEHLKQILENNLLKLEEMISDNLLDLFEVFREMQRDFLENHQWQQSKMEIAVTEIDDKDDTKSK